MNAAAATTTSDRHAFLEALDIVHSEPAERFERIVRTAREVFGVPLSYLNLADDETLFTITPSALDPRRSTPLSGSFCQFTVQQAEPLVIPDASADPRYASLPGVTRLGVRFYAGVPLTMPGDVRIGSLCLMDTRPRTLSEGDRSTLVDLTRWAERILAEGLQHDRLRTVVRAGMPENTTIAGYDLGGFSLGASGDLGGSVLDWGVTGGSITASFAEVTGPGRAAGILAAGLRGGLRARLEAEPLDAVHGLEAQVRPELMRAETFATLFHCKLDPDTGDTRFVDAGHGIVLLLRADGSSTLIRSTDLPIGLHPIDAERQAGRLRLDPGDTLIIGSNGLLDLGDGTLGTLTSLGARLRELGTIEAFEEFVASRTGQHHDAPRSAVVLHRR